MPLLRPRIGYDNRVHGRNLTSEIIEHATPLFLASGPLRLPLGEAVLAMVRFGTPFWSLASSIIVGTAPLFLRIVPSPFPAHEWLAIVRGYLWFLLEGASNVLVLTAPFRLVFGPAPSEKCSHWVPPRAFTIVTSVVWLFRLVFVDVSMVVV